MTWSLLRAIVLLPGTVLVLVPALLLWAFGEPGGNALDALAPAGVSRNFLF